MSRLIFRIDDIEIGIPAIDIVLPTPKLKDAQLGQAVALGRSSVPGLWDVLAIGRLAALEQNDSASCVRIDTLFHFNQPLAAVSSSTSVADSSLVPFDWAIIEDDGIERLAKQNALDYAQPEGEQGLGASEVGSWGIECGQAVGYLDHVAQDRSFFYRVAQAYNWECSFLHFGEHTASGRRRDGVALTIEPPHWSQGAVSEALFVNPIMAFPFREGLVAIGDDYEILRSSGLSAGLRTILDVANAKALLALPEKYEDWPDMEALERHRRRFGY